MRGEIVGSNRRGGPEGVIDAVEQLAPDGFDNVEHVLSYSQREAIVRGYASKAGFAAGPGLPAVWALGPPAPRGGRGRRRAVSLLCPPTSYPCVRCFARGV